MDASPIPKGHADIDRNQGTRVERDDHVTALREGHRRRGRDGGLPVRGGYWRSWVDGRLDDEADR